MTSNHEFEFFVYGLIGAAPLLVMDLIGGVLCIVFGRRNPKAATLTGIAIGIALATRLILPLASSWLFSVALGSLGEVKFRILVNSFVYSVPAAISLGLLLWAIFGTTPRGHGRNAEILLDEGPPERAKFILQKEGNHVNA